MNPSDMRYSALKVLKTKGEEFIDYGNQVKKKVYG